MRYTPRLALPVLISTLFLASGVHAQSNATFYGVFDVGMEHFNHASPNGSGVTRMTTIASSVPSLIGVRGSEDLGNGLKATFVLENGFAPGQGTAMQNGRLFGRQSTLGLRGSWGQIDFGRQWTTTFQAVIDSNVIGPAAFSIGALDGYIPNARVDNSISYYGTFNGLTIGGVYSLGRDTMRAGNCGGEQKGRACTAWSALVKYSTDQWGVTAAYDELRGGPGAHPITVIAGAPGVAFNHSGDKDQRYYLNGYVKLANIKIGSGWLHRNIETDTRSLHTNLYYIGASLPIIQNLTLDGQFFHMDNPSYDTRARLLVLRANYAFSKRTTAYISVGHIENRGDGPAYSVSASSPTAIKPPKPGQNQTGTLIGLRYVF